MIELVVVLSDMLLRDTVVDGLMHIGGLAPQILVIACPIHESK